MAKHFNNLVFVGALALWLGTMALLRATESKWRRAGGLPPFGSPALSFLSLFGGFSMAKKLSSCPIIKTLLAWLARKYGGK